MAQLQAEVNKSQAIRDRFAENANSSAKEVVAALADKGITVTEGHVYVVKGKMSSKKGRPARKNGAAKKSNGKSLSKSASIRNLFKENPKLSAKEVVAELANDGIKVAEGLVYYVKGKMKGRRGRRRKTREVVATVATTTGSPDAVKTILKIKAWATEVGGMKKLKALVEALSE